MRFLIDGYNLLNASVVSSRASGRTELERARLGLLDFLAASIDPRDLTRTFVVFDAAGAPPGLPAQSEHAGMQIRFARDHTCADAMIENLIETCKAPRSLVIVSSDHRLHRAARRRKAKVVDSERWLADLVAKRRLRDTQTTQEPNKPASPPSQSELAYWVEKFSTPE